MVTVRLSRCVGFALIIAMYVVGCSDSSGPGDSTPPSSDATLVLFADRSPALGETTTLTARYSIDYPPVRSDTLTWVASGHFTVRTPFVIESGASTWVDTVRSFANREHSVVIRATQRGQFLVDAVVGAPFDSTFSAGAKATLLLNVR